MRLRSRPRRERSKKPHEIGREFRGVSLWRGRLWRPAQTGRETSLGEAGIQHQSCLYVGLSKSGSTVVTPLALSRAWHVALDHRLIGV